MASDIKEAFGKLRDSISSEDAQDFQSTTLQDVRSAVRKIEQQQAQRQSLRNMRRIEPFLNFMETYSRVIEVACQGFSPMAWVWGPLKLMLQLASQYTNVFDKLLEAYKQIAEELPRVDRLRRTFGNDSAFLKILALIYVDITDFHKRAYKFFRRRAWYMIFECTWRNFEHRFGAILASLRRHTDLLDREAASVHFAEVKEAALVAQRKVDDTEAEKRRAELKEVQRWLSVDGVQEARLGRLANRCQPGSCEWLFRNESIVSWLHPNRNKPVLWIKGKPGSGKSVACSQLVDHLDEHRELQCAFYFCNFSPDDSDTCVLVIRSIAAQLLRSQPDIVTYVHRTYVDVAQITSIKRMKSLLSDILAVVKGCRVILDGIDECNVEQQKLIISTFLSFQNEATDSCKILFSSRHDESHITRQLSRKTVISLKGQTDEAIALYAKHKIAELSNVFEGLDETFLMDIQRQLSSKAEGMFLWVRLVINELENQTSVQELKSALKRLPKGLDEAYERILNRIRCKLGDFERQQALQVLSWVCCSLRPLRVYEIQDGVAFRPGYAKPNLESRICRSIFELCGPLIEELPNGTVDTVHFSAKEYLIHQHSGPFIDPAMAHGSLAFACISYLNTRIGFITRDHSTSDSDKLDGLLLQGFSGLDDYATQFWIDHILTYMKYTPVDARCTETTNELWTFATVWRKSHLMSLGKDNASQYVEEKSLHDSHPTVRGMLEEVTFFRKQCRLREAASCSYDLEIQWQIDRDPTHLNQVSKLVSDAVHNLLTISFDQVPSHLDEADLRRFRHIYGMMGFRCRNSACRAISKIYSTDQERKTHEESHRKSYHCMDCDEKPSGFSSASALRKHRESYHAKLEDFEVPLAVVDRSASRMEGEEDYIIKCFCGFQVDDGNTVLCERCKTWQHIECYYCGHYRNGMAFDIKKIDHACVDCLPRPYDKNSAIERKKTWFQRMKDENRVPTLINPPPPRDRNIMDQILPEGMDNAQYDKAFASLENQDVLDNFDFDSFLQNNDEFNVFDPSLPFSNPVISDKESQRSSAPLNDYQTQLMILEQQGKKRALVARAGQDAYVPNTMNNIKESQSSEAALDYDRQLFLLGQQNKIRLLTDKDRRRWMDSQPLPRVLHEALLKLNPTKSIPNSTWAGLNRFMDANYVNRGVPDVVFSFWNLAWKTAFPDWESSTERADDQSSVAPYFREGSEYYADSQAGPPAEAASSAAPYPEELKAYSMSANSAQLQGQVPGTNNTETISPKEALLDDPECLDDDSIPPDQRHKFHSCPIPTCGRLFKTFEHLKRHVRTHTQERPCVDTNNAATISPKEALWDYSEGIEGETLPPDKRQNLPPIASLISEIPPSDLFASAEQETKPGKGVFDNGLSPLVGENVHREVYGPPRQIQPRPPAQRDSSPVASDSSEFMLPPALLEQYPALRGLRWDRQGL